MWDQSHRQNGDARGGGSATKHEGVGSRGVGAHKDWGSAKLHEGLGAQPFEAEHQGTRGRRATDGATSGRGLEGRSIIPRHKGCWKQEANDGSLAEDLLPPLSAADISQANMPPNPPWSPIMQSFCVSCSSSQVMIYTVIMACLVAT